MLSRINTYQETLHDRSFQSDFLGLSIKSRRLGASEFTVITSYKKEKDEVTM